MLLTLIWKTPLYTSNFKGGTREKRVVLKIPWQTLMSQKIRINNSKYIRHIRNASKQIDNTGYILQFLTKKDVHEQIERKHPVYLGKLH